MLNVVLVNVVHINLKSTPVNRVARECRRAQINGILKLFKDSGKEVLVIPQAQL